jgi:hypothetical protein
MRECTFFVLLISLFCGMGSANAQKPKPKKSIKAVPGVAFHPTFTMGPGSVGRYFYPQAVGSLWEMKIVERYYDAMNHVIAADSMNSFERVISNSQQSFQGLPLILCEAKTWRGPDSSKADRTTDEYYVDDSLIMAVMNNSVQNGENHILLVTPLKIGAHWLEKTGDSARCEIVSMHDTVTTPYGRYGNALVTVTKLGRIELAKYFVAGVGLVKTVMRSPGKRPGDTDVVTSELVRLVHGTDGSGGSSSDGKAPTGK